MAWIHPDSNHLLRKARQHPPYRPNFLTTELIFWLVRGTWKYQKVDDRSGGNSHGMDDSYWVHDFWTLDCPRHADARAARRAAASSQPGKIRICHWVAACMRDAANRAGSLKILNVLLKRHSSCPEECKGQIINAR